MISLLKMSSAGIPMIRMRAGSVEPGGHGLITAAAAAAAIAFLAGRHVSAQGSGRIFIIIYRYFFFKAVLGFRVYTATSFKEMFAIVSPEAVWI